MSPSVMFPALSCPPPSLPLLTASHSKLYSREATKCLAIEDYISDAAAKISSNPLSNFSSKYVRTQSKNVGIILDKKRVGFI